MRVTPTLALPHHAQRAEGRKESDPVTARGRRFLGGGLSGRGLPPRTVRGLVDMTVTPPPVCSRSPRYQSRSSDHGRSRRDRSRSHRDRSRSYGSRRFPHEHACSHRHRAGSHDRSHHSTDRSRSRECRYRPRQRSDREQQKLVAGSCVRGHSVPEPTLQNLVSLLVGLTEKRNENGSRPRCGQTGTAADSRSRLEPGVAAEAPARNASARAVASRRVPPVRDPSASDSSGAEGPS